MKSIFVHARFFVFELEAKVRNKRTEGRTSKAGNASDG